MKIHVYTVMRNEERILPFYLRHYGAVAEKIIVYDDQSDDRTREILSAHPKVELRDYPGNLLDDGLTAKLFSNAYREDRSPDWVMCVDADEFVWSEDLIGHLAEAKAGGHLCIACNGWEMMSETFPFGDGQIYEEIQEGKRTTWWVNGGRKGCVFQPAIDIWFDAGRHVWSVNGNRNGSSWFDSPVKLLHFRDLGHEYYLWRHQRNAGRLHPNNREHGWGAHNHSPLSAERFAAHIKGRVRVT